MIKFAQDARPRGKRPANRKRNRRPSRQKSRRRPTLKFSASAWAKLLYLRDAGDTEIGGFGITSAVDLMLVEDLQLVRQSCSETTVRFDDDAVADFFDEQIDAGRRPEQFARIWLHTHPGDSPQPSCVDEETFERCFGSVDWAVMFMLARGGKSYSRLRYNLGPGSAARMNVNVEFEIPFLGADSESWEAEYEENVETEPVWDDSKESTDLSISAACGDIIDADSISMEWLKRYDESIFTGFQEEDRCLTKTFA